MRVQTRRSSTRNRDLVTPPPPPRPEQDAPPPALDRADTVVLKHSPNERDEHDRAHPLPSSLQSDTLPVPTLGITLSQGTMQQLMMETGPMTTAMLSQDPIQPHINVAGKQIFSPFGYESNELNFVDNGDGQQTLEHSTPYSIQVETEAMHVVSEEVAYTIVNDFNEGDCNLESNPTVVHSLLPVAEMADYPSKDHLLGRQVFDVKVCACPGRDAAAAEKDTANAQKPAKSAAPKRPAACEPGPSTSHEQAPNHGTFQKVTKFTTIDPIDVPGTSSNGQGGSREDEVYNVQVRGRELYKIVMTIVKNYELSRQYEEIVARISLAARNQQTEMNTHSVVDGRNAKLEMNEANATHEHDDVIIQQLTPNTTIRSWLQSLQSEGYINAFNSLGCNVMQDLEGKISLDKLADLGIPSHDARRLYASYVSYSAVQEQKALSTIGSVPSPTKNLSTQSNTSSVGSTSGYRLSKTTVKHLYKMPQQYQLKKQKF